MKKDDIPDKTINNKIGNKLIRAAYPGCCYKSQ